MLDRISQATSPGVDFTIRTLWPDATSSDETDGISGELDWPDSPSRLCRRTAIPQVGSVPFRKGNGINLRVESSLGDSNLEVPAEPCLRATRISDLSVMSELDLEESSEIEGGRGTRSRQQEDNTDSGLVSPISEMQKVTANIGGGSEDLPVKLPPHLRRRRRNTCVERPVFAFNSPDVAKEESRTLPSFTLTVAGAVATGGTAADPSVASNSAVESLLITPIAGSAGPSKSSITSRPTISYPALPPLEPAANRVNRWNSFAAQPQAASNRPGRTASIIPAAVSGSYGSPRVPIVVDQSMENTLFFSRWPTVDTGRPTSKPRTVIITELPDNPTLAMVSRICKNTGLIESITLVPGVRRATVMFIEASDAQRFHDRTGNGIVLHYDRGGQPFKKTVFVEIRKDVDILSSAMRTRVDEAGHSRVIRIVGWERRDLEQVTGIKDGTSEALLENIAAKCVVEGKTERIESVTAHLNAGGHMEATLVFAGIKEAYHALGTVKRMPAFEACNITFGKDP